MWVESRRPLRAEERLLLDVGRAPLRPSYQHGRTCHTKTQQRRKPIKRRIEQSVERLQRLARRSGEQSILVATQRWPGSGGKRISNGTKKRGDVTARRTGSDDAKRSVNGANALGTTLPRREKQMWRGRGCVCTDCPRPTISECSPSKGVAAQSADRQNQAERTQVDCMSITAMHQIGCADYCAFRAIRCSDTRGTIRLR